MSTPSGWYDDGAGRQRWWDGQQWTDRYEDAEAPPLDEPVMSFDSEIEGKDSVVRIYADRVEWVRKSGGVSAGKIMAGVLTAGVSLAATGVGKGGYSAAKSSAVSILPLSAVSGITSVKDGKRVSVTVTTPSMALTLGLPRKQAEQVARTLNQLAHTARAASANPNVTVQINAPSQPAATPPAEADATTHIQKLAELHQQGILSDDEFAAAKAKALGLV